MSEGNGNQEMERERPVSKGVLGRVGDFARGYFFGKSSERGAIPMAEYQGDKLGQKVEDAAGKVAMGTAAVGAAVTIASSPDANQKIMDTTQAVVHNVGDYTDNLGATIHQAVAGPDITSQISKAAAEQNAKANETERGLAAADPRLDPNPLPASKRSQLP